MKLRQQPSPNCGPRRGGLQPSLIVLHYTAMTSAEAALDRLCDPKAEVSAHYLISRSGEVVQLVDEADRAWHAGSGAWGGQGDVNSRSIGIELDNASMHPFSESLMTALERLMPGIMERWSIKASGVIGHSDMAPGRKIDPGRRFDWRRLALQGLAVWPEAGGQGDDPDAEHFAQLACQFGYPEVAPDTLLDAIRQRFRPYDTGPLCAADMVAIADLARRFPVDRGSPNA